MFVPIAVLTVAITITFSEKSIVSQCLNRRFCYWLGKFSLSLYLNHMVVRTVMVKWSPNIGYYRQMAIYLMASIVLSLICMYAVDGLQKLCRRIGPWIERVLIAEELNENEQ